MSRALCFTRNGDCQSGRTSKATALCTLLLLTCKQQVCFIVHFFTRLTN